MVSGDRVEGAIGAVHGEVGVNQGDGDPYLDQSHAEKGKKVSNEGVDRAASSSRSGEQVEHMIANLRLTAAESAAEVIDDVDDLNWLIPIGLLSERFFPRMSSISRRSSRR
jgi:hypothetical protein